MAKTFGFNVAIGGDTTKLNKAIKESNSSIKEAQSALKELNKLTKIDPTNIEAYRKKQKALNDELGAAEKKYALLYDQQEKMNKALADGTITTKEWAEFNVELKNAEENYKSLKKEADNYNPTLSMMSDMLGNASKKLEDLSKKTEAFSKAGAAVAGSMLGMAYNAATTADDLNTLSKQYNISTAEIQKMNYAQDLIDVSTDTMLASFAKLTKQIGSENDAFEELGVSIKDANGEYRDAEDVWYDTLEALSKIENETQRDVYAQELFGKSAADLAGVIDDGGQALKELGQEAENAGLILSQDALDNANAFNDGIDKLKSTATQAFLEAGASLATNLLPVMGTLVEKLSGVLQWLGQLDGNTLQMILTIAGVVAAVSPVLSLLAKLTSVLSALCSPIGLVVAGFTAAIAVGVLVYKNWDKIAETGRAMYRSVSTTVSNLKNSVVNAFSNLKNGAVNAVSNLKNSVVSLFSQAASGAQNAWNGVTSFFSGIWSGIKAVFNEVASWFKSIFGSASGEVKSSFSGITSFFSGIWSGIKSVFSGVSGFFGDAFSSASSAIEGAFSGVTGFFSSVWSSVTSGLDTIDYRINQSAANAANLNATVSTGSYSSSSRGSAGSISYYAEGGLLRTGMGIVAEAGPELIQMTSAGALITPLNGSSGHRGNNISINVNASFGEGYSTKNARQLARMINRELGAMYG